MEPFAVVFVIVMMVIGGIKWLLENLSGNQKRGQDQGDASFADLYEDARQQILERQARQHAQQDATEPVAQQRIIEPVIASPPPVPAPPPLPGRRPLVAQAQPTRSVSSKPLQRPVLTAAEMAALKRVQKREIEPRSRSRRSTRTSARQMLSSPAATRDAIVLLEILGPPKGAI
jgi:hypothetical protein